MQHVSDRKYAQDMGLSVEQVRKMIKRLDIEFFSSGKGDSMVYMFDPNDMNDALASQKTAKKDRKRGPRRRKKGKGKGKAKTANE